MDARAYPPLLHTRMELGSSLQRIPCFKYYNVVKRESRFTLGVDYAKIIAYINNNNNNRQDSLSSALKTPFSVGKEEKPVDWKLSTLICVSTTVYGAPFFKSKRYSFHKW